MDAKQQERLIGVHFNKKLDGFLNAIWHHEDLANSPLTAPRAYPIENAGQTQQQAEEIGEMRIEYEDMDMDGSVYEDLDKADDDSGGEEDDSEEDDDSDMSGASDDDDGDDSGNIFRPSYDKNEERLLFLERALPLRRYDSLRIKRRPRFKQLRRLKQVHRRYMVMGSQSSFEEFVSLRAYGCVAARNDMPSCLLYWSDDGQRVGWGQGVEISMGQFRALTEYLIKEVIGLCNSLMFGLEPDIDLSQIKDDMANNDNRYSFVTDPKNKLTSAYLDLLNRACTARHGCLSRGNRWNWSEVDRYCKKEEDFRELLGPAMSLTGGQQPRWLELSSLWVENGELGPRGLYVYKGDRERVLGHHPSVTAESIGETAERSIAETQLTPGQKRADARGRGHEQKLSSPDEVHQITSPPAKRRRIQYVAPSPVDKTSPSLTESEAPELFRNPHEPYSHDNIKERRAVLQFLHKYSSARSEKWLLHDRLTRVYKTLEWWEFVGCQLCFIAKGGQPEPDHTVESCFQSAGCSICAPFIPCREVVYADAVLMANSPEAKRHLKERLESKSGLDNHCEKKPIIRSVIAALCAYDNQFLGKILLIFGQDGDGKNLNDDRDARSWFEEDIHLDNFTFPRLFMVFELVVLSFYFRTNQGRALAELAGFPERAPTGLMPISHSNREETERFSLIKHVD
ncbi:telomere-associated helicase [Fusarium beomiforme]|uniref:Telomere-associated helicase n=1 Tax=Fusarium beomiforme TaxID=44412 RepID=A0A9P5AA33_9HYPO|nr:telomere-associated helicase [Fusarium beomiforme]